MTVWFNKKTFHPSVRDTLSFPFAIHFEKIEDDKMKKKIQKDIENKKSRLVVYTAMFGDYDKLIDPPEKYEGCDFICFTDQKYLKSNIWSIRLIENDKLTPNMMNRKYKIMPHIIFPEYDESLYIDANIAILKNPKDLSDKYLTLNDFVVPKHPVRDCIYDEAVECIILMKDKTKKLRNQIQRYKESGFPVKFGLSENGILLRRHLDRKVVALMIAWWNELQKESQRDQLSLPYVIWKSHSKFYFMDESPRIVKDYFAFTQHKQSMNKSLCIQIKDKLKFGVRRLLVNWL